MGDGSLPSGAPHAERDRIARLGSDRRLLVFGFWTGRLPELARLHFLTVAKALPADSRYVLFVHRATMSDAMRNLLHACHIEIAEFDLSRLMVEMGAASLMRRTPLRRHWRLVQRLAMSGRWARLLTWFGHDHSHAFTPRSNFLLGGPPRSAVVLSNYARVLISTIVPGHTLYTDLDVAFPRRLDWIYGHRSFVYRWQRRPFANSAIMAVTADSSIKRGALLARLLREGTGRSWILFSEPNCAACGLDILPCDRLDPLWSGAGPDGPEYRAAFFRRRHTSAAELAFLQESFDAVHWHNKWKIAPEPGSPYDLWLRALNAGEAHLPPAEGAARQ